MTQPSFKFLSGVIALLFLSSPIFPNRVYAETVAGQTAVVSETRLEKLQKIAEIKDKLMADVVESQTPDTQAVKSSNINAVLNIEHGLLKEAKYHELETKAAASAAKPQVIPKAKTRPALAQMMQPSKDPDQKKNAPNPLEYWFNKIFRR